MWRRLLGFVRKDIRVFLVDRQAVVMAFVVPVMIASILGYLDGKAANPSTLKNLPADFVDEDKTPLTASILDALKRDGTIAPVLTSESQAREDVLEGKRSSAIVLHRGFSEQATAALTGGAKPKANFLVDPAKAPETQVVKGLFMEKAASAVAVSAFGGFGANGSAPFELAETKTTAGAGSSSWSIAAHDYARFGMQGLLFFAMEAAVGLARERRQGIWKRLQAAPIPGWLIVAGRGLSAMVIALGIVLAMFGFGALVFHFRVLGSPIGFAAMALATSAMAATFALLVSTIGRSETQSRGLSVLLILILLAIGGAWFPLARLPETVQQISSWLPIRWAVEGFDAVTWRGLPLETELRYAGVLTGFAGVFGLLALVRFRTASA